jgi:hypothetical protein
MGIKRGRVVIRCRGIIKGREWTDDKWRGLDGGREILLIPKPGGPDPIPMMGPIRFKGNTM